MEQPISVEDEDEDPTFTYNITGGNFRINSTSGEIYTASKLDRETTNKFSLTVGVFDEIHAVSTSVEIEVEDENDNSPILPKVTYVTFLLLVLNCLTTLKQPNHIYLLNFQRLCLN